MGAALPSQRPLPILREGRVGCELEGPQAVCFCPNKLGCCVLYGFLSSAEQAECPDVLCVSD